MEWLPNESLRRQRCLNYRSPLKDTLRNSLHDAASRRNWRRRALTQIHRKSSYGLSTDSERGEALVHVASDSDMSSLERSIPSPRLHAAPKNSSDFESSLPYYDATEHMSAEDTVSWQSAVSDLEDHLEIPVALQLDTAPRTVPCSHRKLLHSCGFSQYDSNGISDDEVIQKTTATMTREATPCLKRGSKSEAKNWRCCRFRSSRSRGDEVRCGCLCLYAFRAA